MTNIILLHEQFKLTVNRLDSNYNKTFSVSVIDAYLNRAQDVIMEKLMGRPELTTKVRNHLRVLEQKEVELKIIEKQDEHVIARYPKDFYRLLRQRVYTKTADCDEVRRIKVRTIPSDKLAETLDDPYWKPSFEWKETVGDEGSKGYYVFTESGWDVQKVVVDYLRKPKTMAAFNLSGCTKEEPYIMADQTVVTRDRHCEFSDTYLWRWLADLAALYALRDLGQVDDSRTKMEEMIFSEIMKV